jgi:hypothetical protein
MSVPRFHTISLRRAALDGDAKTIKQLLSDEKTLPLLIRHDKNNNLPLDQAAVRGHSEVVKLLVQYHRSSPYKYTIRNNQGYHPLVTAAHWWCKTIQGLTKEDIRVGIFNDNNPEKAYFEIMRDLIINYNAICKEVEIGQTEWVHNANSLYHIIRIMTLKTSQCGDINTHRKNAQFIAQKLLNRGVSLDIRTNAHAKGHSPRSLAKKEGIIALIEKMEENAAKAKWQPILPASQNKTKKMRKRKHVKDGNNNKIGNKTSADNDTDHAKWQSVLPEPKNEPKKIAEKTPIKQEEKENKLQYKKSTANNTTHAKLQFVLSAPKHGQKKMSEKNPVKKAEKIPFLLENKKENLLVKNQETLSAITKKARSQLNYFLKRAPHLQKKNPFTIEEVNQMIETHFAQESKNIVNKETRAKKILEQLSGYNVTQHKKKRAKEIIVQHLSIEQQYRGILFCKKKETILIFNQSTSKEELDKLFSNEKYYKELVNYCLNPCR